MFVFGLWLLGRCNESKDGDGRGAGGGCKGVFRWVGGGIRGWSCVGVMVVICVELGVGGGCLVGDEELVWVDEVESSRETDNLPSRNQLCFIQSVQTLFYY